MEINQITILDGWTGRSNRISLLVNMAADQIKESFLTTTKYTAINFAPTWATCLKQYPKKLWQVDWSFWPMRCMQIRNYLFWVTPYRIVKRETKLKTDMFWTLWDHLDDADKLQMKSDFLIQFKIFDMIYLCLTVLFLPCQKLWTFC